MPDPHHFIIVLGDQLDRSSAAFRDFDASQDRVWMAEVVSEATHVWCHKLRIAAFFSAMRHFRDELRSRDVKVDYRQLAGSSSDDEPRTFREALQKSCRKKKPARLIVLHPGDYRVLHELQSTADSLQLELEVREDDSFYCTHEQFRDWAKDRKSLVLENFYRQLRKQHDILVNGDQQPVEGEWNFDKMNRETFGKEGPDDIKAPRSFRPDKLTNEVIMLVEKRFSDHPGTLDHFDLPMNRKQALALLRDFIEHRLPNFGHYQDAMWTDRSFLYHSRLSFALNMHLLRPREVVDRAVEAYHAGQAPINSVEGFVRQILGWREFVRGIYWQEMPRYAERNALRCGDVDVPSFFWDGKTEMRCIAEAMQGVLSHGYAHHIHRLMVLGLFSLLYGVHPAKFNDWHLAMYVDAIDWVSLPNTLGMSQFGDGGVVGTKPYCASGNYINRMGNYCKNCRYDHKSAEGPDACPMTVLYWDFLARHEKQFQDNRRMTMQLKNLQRKDDVIDDIRKQAREIKRTLQNGESI